MEQELDLIYLSYSEKSVKIVDYLTDLFTKDEKISGIVVSTEVFGLLEMSSHFKGGNMGTCEVGKLNGKMVTCNPYKSANTVEITYKLPISNIIKIFSGENLR